MILESAHQRGHALARAGDATEAIGGVSDGGQTNATPPTDLLLRHPSANHRDELLFNAAVSFRSANNLVAARRTFEDVIAKFPRSALVSHARRALATLP